MNSRASTLRNAVSEARLTFGNAELERTPERIFAQDRIRVYGPHDQGRGAAEALIEDVYAEAFGAKIKTAYPNLFALTGRSGAVIAAAGFRWAGSVTLFLERYLRAPIEVLASDAFDTPVARESIVEIGSLASRGAGASLLFAALAAYLHAQGAAVAAATLTRKLLRTFEAVGMHTQVLARASEAHAGASGDWGAYYAHDPSVVIGRVARGRDALSRFAPTGRR